MTTSFDGSFRTNSPVRLNREVLKMLGGANFFCGWGAHYKPDRANRFRLHHLHGEVTKISTVRTSMNQYLSGITWIKNHVIHGPHRIYKDLNARCGYCGTCSACYWTGRDTWIEKFLLEDLAVIGLALSRQDYFLRYLLLQRQKIHNFKPELSRRLVISYPNSELSALDSAQDAELLALMGAEIVSVCDYRCIWENDVFYN